MPAIVQLGLSQVLTSADELICRWIELPTSVRTIAAFENLLRGKQLGGQLQGGTLRFLRAGGIVIDTACLIGDLIEVVAGGGEREAAAQRPAQEAADQAAASKQSGGSGAGDQLPQAAQSDAAAADSAQGSAAAAAAAAAAEAGAIAGGTSAGDAAAWQAFRQLSRPERLRAAEQMSVEERAAIRAAGVPEEAMEVQWRMAGCYQRCSDWVGTALRLRWGTTGGAVTVGC